MARFGPILKESTVVLVTGVLFGLLANGVSPVGLSLRRNYFPADGGRNKAFAGQKLAVEKPAQDTGDELPKRAKASAEKRFQFVEYAEAVAMHNDARRMEEAWIWIDARPARQYVESHIPGAYHLDHFRIEDQLDAVLPLCQAAEKIVVYCNGGECEESEFTAEDLVALGIDNQRLWIYRGGFAEWSEKAQPTEIEAYNGATNRRKQRQNIDD